MIEVVQQEYDWSMKTASEIREVKLALLEHDWYGRRIDTFQSDYKQRTMLLWHSIGTELVPRRDGEPVPSTNRPEAIRLVTNCPRDN